MIKVTVQTEFQLRSFFTEIEAIVNNRPLTHASDTDFETLNPNHFLLGRLNTTGEVCQNVDVYESSRRKGKLVVAITKQFWKRLLSDYLPIVKQRTK